MHTEYVGGAKVILDEINKHRADVEKLVGVIGNLGVTSGYLHEANSARFSLYIWQSSTVVALLGLIGVAFTMAFPHRMGDDFGAIKSIVGIALNADTAKNAVAATSANVSSPQISNTFLFYQSLATRIFLSITFGIFAAYSSSQAEKYMEIERRNRKLALEFTAVGPFIAPMPIEMQNKFREELGGKSFGVAEPVKHKRRDPVTLLDVATRKELEDLILNVWDRIKTKESNGK